MARKPAPKPRKNPKKQKPPRPAPGPGNGTPAGEPQFAEPVRTPDPTQFVTKVTDSQYYKLVDPMTAGQLIQAVPPPRDPSHLLMSLGDAYGPKKWKGRMPAIQKARRIVFHAAGDTGPTHELKNVEAVADKMCADFEEADPGDVPAFFYHLGDVVYNFGEDEYYYDQFYEPFRNYNAPILAIPGNHDGEVYPGEPEGTLQAFQKHFCSPAAMRPREAAGLSRTTMTQPGVYFALDAPFVRIIGLYSNVLEDPGVVSSEGNTYTRVGDAQLAFLKDQLKSCSNYKGAIIVAVHHPPVVVGGRHGSSPRMLQDIDACCKATGVYPHAVLSGHAHNYQRFTRLEGGRETPYVVAGMGGHNVQPPFRGKTAAPPRPPFQAGQFRCDNYSVQYGYLRLVANSELLSIEFHDGTAGTASKAAADVVTVELATHKLTTARP
jgi:hypothetical protein